MLHWKARHPSLTMKYIVALKKINVMSLTHCRSNRCLWQLCTAELSTETRVKDTADDSQHWLSWPRRETFQQTWTEMLNMLLLAPTSDPVERKFRRRWISGYEKNFSFLYKDLSFHELSVCICVTRAASTKCAVLCSL